MIYTAGIHIYQGLAKLASLCGHSKARRMLKGRKEHRPVPSAQRSIWLHAASLGEFEQGRVLLEKIRKAHPQARIVLSFYSPSGYEVRRDWPVADEVVYLPADTPRAMKRFLDAVNPQVAVMVKYEFWGNCLRLLQERGVPVYLISAVFRPGQIFFKPWGGMFRRMLKRYTRIYVQDRASAELLAAIGVTDVTVAGDTRFDRVTQIRAAARCIPELDAFTAGGSRLTLAVGSSWPQDEALYIPIIKKLAPRVRVIIAPHEFDSARLESLRARLEPELKVAFFTQIKDGNPPPDADVLVLDCFGLLSSAYRYAQMAWVGGGFGAGIHNLNEAAVYGIPVIFGPNHGKFIEARDLLGCGGGICVRDAKQTEAALKKLVEDSSCRKKAGDAAGRYIASKTGATDIIFNKIITI